MCIQATEAEHGRLRRGSDPYAGISFSPSTCNVDHIVAVKDQAILYWPQSRIDNDLNQLQLAGIG